MSSSPPPLPPLPSFTTGHCACKRTRYRLDLRNLSRDLTLKAYCHCTSCQRLNAAPFVWTTHWAHDAVEWLAPTTTTSITSKNNNSSSSNSSNIDSTSADKEETHSTRKEMILPSSPTRTRGGARLLPFDPSSSSSNTLLLLSDQASYQPQMAVYESLPGRKWKQRCDHCGTPMGSWNQLTQRWTIWPTTLSRDYIPPSSSSFSSSTIPPEGLPNPTIQAALKPTHHQFYGPWRCLDLLDALPKWSGYQDRSERVLEEMDT